MSTTASSRSSRGRGRKVLPPIPERSGQDQLKRVRAGRKRHDIRNPSGLGAQPQPSSHNDVVVAVESRDDEGKDAKKFGGERPVPKGNRVASTTRDDVVSPKTPPATADVTVYAPLKSEAATIARYYKPRAAGEQHDGTPPVATSRWSLSVTSRSSGPVITKLEAEDDEPGAPGGCDDASATVASHSSRSISKKSPARPFTSAPMDPDPSIASAAAGNSKEAHARLCSVGEVGTPTLAEDNEHSSAAATPHASIVAAVRPPEPSWKDYQRARRSERASMKRRGSNNIGGGDPFELRSIPTDEIIDSFSKKPGAESKNYGFDDDPNMSDEETMDNIARETRDQYQLVRLKARIDMRSRGGETTMPSRQQTQVSPSSYKTMRSSRIKAGRNLYSADYRGSRPGKQQKQQQQQHEQRQTVVGGIVGAQEQAIVSPLSSTHGSVHESSIANSKSQISTANNTSANSTIPSLQPGQSINHSLTSSSVQSGLVQSVSGRSGVRSLAPFSAANHSVTGARSVSGTVLSTLQRSASQTSGTAHQTSVSSPELSEYRGKLFAKMLFLLNDLGPNKEVLDEDDVSAIKEKVIDEGRMSCCSVEEIKLIQKLTEEEMSRILQEFEQNNSLVDRKDSGVRSLAPGLGTGGSRAGGSVRRNRGRGPSSASRTSRREDSRNRKLQRMAATREDGGKDDGDSFPMPDKIVYHDEVMTSIASKFSDVTSPTCHDGFELDEIMPGSAQRAQVVLPRGSGSPTSVSRLHNHKKRATSAASLPPPMSPAAAAAAAAAATISLSGMENGSPQFLPSVNEDHEGAIAANEKASEESDENRNGAAEEDRNGATDEDRNGAAEEDRNGAAGEPDVKMHAAEEDRNGAAGEPHVKICAAEEDGNDGTVRPPEVVEEATADVHDAVEVPKDVNLDASIGTEYAEVDHPPAGDRDKIDEGCIEIKASEILAASRDMAVLADSRRQASLRVKANDYHADILSAVAKAGNEDSTRASSDNHDAELFEVTSILSHYEIMEKEKKKKKVAQDEKLNDLPVVVELQGAAAAAGGDKLRLWDQMTLMDNMDEPAPTPKNVSFVEPLPVLDQMDPFQEVDNKPLCGICVIM